MMNDYKNRLLTRIYSVFFALSIAVTQLIEFLQETENLDVSLKTGDFEIKLEDERQSLKTGGLEYMCTK